MTDSDLTKYDWRRRLGGGGLHCLHCKFSTTDYTTIFTTIYSPTVLKCDNYFTMHKTAI